MRIAKIYVKNKQIIKRKKSILEEKDINIKKRRKTKINKYPT